MEYNLKDEEDDSGDGKIYSPSDWSAREAADAKREGGGETVLPEMDFTSPSLGQYAADDSSSGLRDNEFTTQQTNGPVISEPREQRKAAEWSEEEAGPVPPRLTPKPLPAHAPPDDGSYGDAMQRLMAVLKKPNPDYAKGYSEAQQKDEGENRTNRILDYLSAGLRRAPTATLSPAATNASDFLKRQALEQQGQSGELARLGKIAQLAKPAVKKPNPDAGNVDGLRAYLVKVGAGTDAELAGMNEKQLNAVREAYGLKYHASRDAVTDERDAAHFTETQRHNRQTEGAAWAAANRAEGNRVAEDAKDLAGKLGDTAVFEQRYQKLQDLASANGGKLPGLGVIEGVRQQPGIIGSAVRAVSPPKPEAIEGRKALRQLAADYARAISGAGVSDRERAILNSASIDVDNDDSGIAMAGLKSLKEMYDAKAAQLKKGYRPEAVQQVAGTVKVQFPNGSTADVPEADVAEATSKFGGKVLK
jgi:hypothetical protein